MTLVISSVLNSPQPVGAAAVIISGGTFHGCHLLNIVSCLGDDFFFNVFLLVVFLCSFLRVCVASQVVL